jgi:hypothetical protein
MAILISTGTELNYGFVEVQTNSVITKNSINYVSTFTFPVQESGLELCYRIGLMQKQTGTTNLFQFCYADGKLFPSISCYSLGCAVM